METFTTSSLFHVWKSADLEGTSSPATMVPISLDSNPHTCSSSQRAVLVLRNPLNRAVSVYDSLTDHGEISLEVAIFDSMPYLQTCFTSHLRDLDFKALRYMHLHAAKTLMNLLVLEGHRITLERSSFSTVFPRLSVPHLPIPFIFN